MFQYSQLLVRIYHIKEVFHVHMLTCPYEHMSSWAFTPSTPA